MALERRRALLLTLLLTCLLTLVACVPSLGFDFVEWDDPLHLTRNPLVLEPASMSLREHLLTPALGYPIPLTIFSYRVEHMLFGMTPWIFHATNALLHTLVTALAFMLGRRLGLSTLAAATAALFFALHPANAETMSWVSGRKDLLAASFGLTALLCSLGTVRTRVLSVFLYACALLCKPAAAPIAALVPLLYLSIERDPSTRPSARSSLAAQAKQAALRIAPYLVVLLPIAYLGIVGQAAVGATSDEKVTSISPVLAALYAAGHHAGLMLGWVEPTVKYFPSEWPPLHPGQTDAALVVLVISFGSAIFVCRGALRRIALFGAAFALLAYLPSSSLLFPLTRYLADAYVYLPLMGFGLVLGARADRGTSRAGDGVRTELRDVVFAFQGRLGALVARKDALPRSGPHLPQLVQRGRHAAGARAGSRGDRHLHRSLWRQAVRQEQERRAHRAGPRG